MVAPVLSGTSSETFTCAGSILPSANEAFDLGDSTHRWRDLYLSGSTIYLGSTAMSVGQNGALSISNLLTNKIAPLTGNLIDLSGATISNVSLIGNGSRLTSVSNAVGAWSTSGSNLYILGSNVGVGTSSPSCIFHVNDTLSGIIASGTINAYPPQALTSNTTTVSGAAYGNGTYVVTASSGAATAYRAFDGQTGFDQWWMDSGNYNASTGAYQGAFTTTASGSNLAGEYLQVQMPASLVPLSYSITPRQESYYLERRNVTKWWLVGSSNGSTWDILDSQETEWSSTADKTFNLSTNTAYSYFRVVCGRVGNSNMTNDRGFATIGELTFVATTQSINYNGALSFMVSALNEPMFVVTGEGYVGVGTTAPTEKLSVVGNVVSSGSIASSGGKIGYAAGAGGAVTQATSRTTGVTLNKLTGEITLVSSSLAANTAETFTLTNSYIAAGDHVVVSQVGGTAAQYVCQAVASAGAATISIRNPTASATATEAPVLKFTVLKATLS